MNRIKQLRNELKINQDVLADLLGLEVAAISKLETGRVPLKDGYIVKLSEYFNVSCDYLLGKNTKNTKKLLPVLGIVKAGYNYLAQENILEYIDPAMDLPNNQEYFCLIVKGNSMSPMIDEGDYLIVKKEDGNFINNDICIVLINGDEATVKKVVRTDTGIELHAANPYYPIQQYTFKEVQEKPVRVIGTVIRQIRKFK